MDSSTRAGTISGTFLVLLFNVNLEELLSTAIIAAVGAVVSFLVSILLKCVFKKKGSK